MSTDTPSSAQRSGIPISLRPGVGSSGVHVWWRSEPTHAHTCGARPHHSIPPALIRGRTVCLSSQHIVETCFTVCQRVAGNALGDAVRSETRATRRRPRLFEKPRANASAPGLRQGWGGPSVPLESAASPCWKAGRTLRA